VYHGHLGRVYHGRPARGFFCFLFSLFLRKAETQKKKKKKKKKNRRRRTRARRP
jgi:hypothetical protein